MIAGSRRLPRWTEEIMFSGDGREERTDEARVEGERDFRLRREVTMRSRGKGRWRTSSGERKQQSDGQTQGAG